MQTRHGFLVGLVYPVVFFVGTASVSGEAVPDRLDLETALSFALEHNFAIRRARERIRE